MIHNCSISTTGDLFSTANTRQKGSECLISAEEASKEVANQATFDPEAAPRPTGVDTWSYVDSSASAGGSLFTMILIMAIVPFTHFTVIF